MSTLTGSSSQNPDPLHPNGDGSALGDGDNADPAFWKRRYHAIQESVNAQNKTKRKSGSVNLIFFNNCTDLTIGDLQRNSSPTSQLGRGIRKVVFLCGEIKDLVSESDSYLAYMEDADDPDLNCEFEGLNDDEVEELKYEYVTLFRPLFVLFTTNIDT